MSDMSRKARASMRSKARKMAGADPSKHVDASSWTPPENINSTMKTGARPIRARIYKHGGKIQGDRARRLDRKPRASGGRAADCVDAKVNRDVVAANAKLGKYHEGGYKKGGRLKRDMGGMADPRATAQGALMAAANRSGTPQARMGSVPTGNTLLRPGALAKGGTVYGGTRPTGGRMPHAKGGTVVAKDDKLKHQRASGGPASNPDRERVRDLIMGNWPAKERADSNGPAPIAKERGYEAKDRKGELTPAKQPRARGGRTKGGSKINIIIAQPHPQQQQAAMPAGPVRPPAQPVPVPPPGMPPSGMPMGMPMGGMGMPPGGAAPPMGGPPPAGLPPLQRAKGGSVTELPGKVLKGKSYRSPADMDAGACNGKGALEKREVQRNSKYAGGGAAMMTAGARGGEGRLQKAEMQRQSQR
jgi:hypothetical protein